MISFVVIFVGETQNHFLKVKSNPVIKLKPDLTVE